MILEYFTRGRKLSLLLCLKSQRVIEAFIVREGLCLRSLTATTDISQGFDEFAVIPRKYLIRYEDKHEEDFF